MRIKYLIASFLILGLAATLIASPALGMGRAPGKGRVARASQVTGVYCLGGTDPTFGFPLHGEIIQCGWEEICATKTSIFPGKNSEDFTDEFMVAVWNSLPEPTQNFVRASAKVSALTHKGTPATPPDNLSEVKRPEDFPAEAFFSSLENRTYVVEFEVPPTHFQTKFLPKPDSWIPGYEPPEKVRLRGWYIKGDGIEGQHPLVIMQTGMNGSIEHPDMPQYRELCAYFLTQGFDVLFFDKRGNGYSDGFIECVGEDLFRVLDQLEAVGSGNGCTALDSTGSSFAGNLLGAYTAKSKPVILWGHSQGSIITEKAMAMNYSNEIIDLRYNDDGTINYAASKAVSEARYGYNFKGVIEDAGFSGSMKYMVTPAWVYFHGLRVAETYSISPFFNSNVYKSIDKWPAYLIIKPTQDFNTTDGVIDVYNNKARGFKDIVMVRGTHMETLFNPYNWPYVAKKTLRWAQRVILNDPPTDNQAETKLQIEVCSAPEIAEHGVLTAADTSLENLIKQWMMEQ